MNHPTPTPGRPAAQRFDIIRPAPPATPDRPRTVLDTLAAMPPATGVTLILAVTGMTTGGIVGIVAIIAATATALATIAIAAAVIAAAIAVITITLSR